MTYDVRCDTDTIDPKKYPDIIVKSPDTGLDTQPFWYAYVIGVFHAQVSSLHCDMGNEKEWHQMNFLWVRWFGMEPG